MLAPSAENLLLGRGSCYFDRFDANGNPTGEQNLGNCTAVESNTEDDKREKFSSQVATSVKLKSVTVQRTVTLNITADEHSLENMALIVMGESSEYEQESGAVTGETVTENSVQGRWYPTEFRRIANVVIAGQTEDEDFQVDSVTGRIYIVPGGGIVDGSTVVVQYEHDNVVLDKVIGSSKNTIEGRFRFIGDPAAGPKLEVLVHKVSVTPGGPMGLITDDFGNMVFAFEILKHDDHSELWQILDITGQSEYVPT